MPQANDNLSRCCSALLQSMEHESAELDDLARFGCDEGHRAIHERYSRQRAEIIERFGFSWERLLRIAEQRIGERAVYQLGLYACADESFTF